MSGQGGQDSTDTFEGALSALEERVRKLETGEVSLDDRKQKHVSFDASSLMRSQTLATMDESR